MSAGYGKSGRKAFLAGWDAAIAARDRSVNPYKRNDYRRRWNQGYSDCMNSKPLPGWAYGHSNDTSTGR